MASLDMRGIELATSIIRDSQIRKRAAKEFDTVQAQREKEAALQDEHRKFVEEMAAKTYDEQLKQHQIQNKFNEDTAKLQKAKFVQEIGRQYIETNQLPAGVTEKPGEVISPARQELVPGVPIPQIGAIKNVPEVRKPSTFVDPAVGEFTLPDPNKALAFQVEAKEKMLAPEIAREKQRIETTGAQNLLLEKEREANRVARDKRLQEGKEAIMKQQEKLRLETEKLRIQGRLSEASINASSRIRAAEIRGTLDKHNKEADLPVHLNKQANEFALAKYNAKKGQELLNTKIAGTDQTVSDYLYSKGTGLSGLGSFLGRKLSEAEFKSKMAEMPKEVADYLVIAGQLKGVRIKDLFGKTYTARDEALASQFMIADGFGEKAANVASKFNTLNEELARREGAIIAAAGSHGESMKRVMDAAMGIVGASEKPKVEDDGKGNLFIK